MRHFLEIFPRLLLSILMLAAISGSLSALDFDQLPPADLDEPPLMDNFADGPDSGMGGDSATVHAEITPPDAKTPPYLFITMDLQPGWHIYSITQEKGKGPIPTEIKIHSNDAIKRVGPCSVSPMPERVMSQGFGFEVEHHHGSVTWVVPLELGPDTNLKNVTIKGKVFTQACEDAGGCVPSQDYPFTATLTANPKQLASLRGMLAKMTTDNQTEIVPTIIAVAQEKPSSPESPKVEPPKVTDKKIIAFLDRIEEIAKGKQKGSLLGSILLGFLGGLILNIMPCVLPVIGLKIMSFIEQAGHDRRHAFMLNAWYSLGMMSIFLLLAGLSVTLGLGWGGLLRYGGVNLVLIAVIFAMALSFLGTWEIPIPGFVGSGKAEAISRKEGPLGAFAKGILTTILATPCSAPLLASALVWTATQPPGNVFAVFISIGLGMSSPYLLIGAFPKLIKFLPKPGEWMETFKQVMGFVLLGTVIFLMMSTEQAKLLAVITFLFGLWAACWWIGKTHVLAPTRIKLLHWGEAIAFSVLIWFFAFGVMAPETDSSAPLKEGDYSNALLYELVNKNQTVLVDFTADWCATCKTFEKTVLDSEAVQNAIQKHNVAMIKADWTREEESEEVDNMLKRLGSKQVPVILIIPNGNVEKLSLFRGSYTTDNIINAIEK